MFLRPISFMAAMLCVIVAEKSSVCLLDGSLERMILISESKHGSSSRSASSSTRKDTFLKQFVKASLKMKCSVSLPGVAHIICGRVLMVCAWDFISSPPRTVRHFNEVPRQKTLNCSVICSANSREGVKQTAKTPTKMQNRFKAPRFPFFVSQVFSVGDFYHENRGCFDIHWVKRLDDFSLISRLPQQNQDVRGLILNVC